MNQLQGEEIQFDGQHLYREETYTDLKTGSIQVLQPVKPDGTPDSSRPTRYMIRTQLMTEMGMLPVQAPVEAASLQDAISQFPRAVEVAVQEMIREAEAIQRERASSIVVPGRTMPQGPGLHVL
jgi:hypothetical protein